MAQERQPYQPPWTERVKSNVTVGIVGFLSRSFLYALNTTNVYGLEGFLEILEERNDVAKRERGLITVSNHLSVYATSSHKPRQKQR